METLTLSSANSVALIILQRPDRLNAINDLMIGELGATLHDLHTNDSTRVAILTGAGEKSFCVGMDLKDRKDMTETTLAAQRTRFVELCATIRHFTKPIIVAVNGYALGGGLEFALNCDFIIASENAIFGLPEVTRGIMPGGGGTQLLPQRIGVARARELIYTGESINAIEALRLGLANRVVPLAELLPTAQILAQKIADNAPIGVRASKQAIAFNQASEEGIRFEAEIYRQVLYSEDRREGFVAFNEKRKPVYQGR
jgi:enoyl-CoA hydratase/carnithine racemase